ncbi:MAG: radical SAM protein [Pseudomonadota bacterium]
MRDCAEPNAGKFVDPEVTLDGSRRATVALTHPTTLWFNTGTLCNIACVNCYIESSPTNDSLVYLSAAEVKAYLLEIMALGWGIEEIGFTGGEPFMNPEMIAMTEAALEAGYRVLILTNAMQPMMRPKVMAGLLRLQSAYPDQMTLRVSLDHYKAQHHDAERGKGGFEKTLKGMDWLRDQVIPMSVAGRSLWTESEAAARAGFADLFEARGYKLDAFDPGQLVIFPEMDVTVDVPEITTECWGILGKSPDSMMCASSRMVIKRRGAERPSVVACTLLPYSPEFELGETLEEAARPVALNHPHCAKFCVLGGASCSA